jgi:Translation initiation factor IF-2, N-terminal region
MPFQPTRVPQHYQGQQQSRVRSTIWQNALYLRPEIIRIEHIMRLGQLARKLSISSAEIVEFLASQNISIEVGANARLDDSHVARIVEKFAPSQMEEILATPKAHDEIKAEEPAREPEPIAPEPPAEIAPASEPALEIPEEKIEVIKAPKIELSGLKVLGKIELPEPKKKEVKEDQAEATLTEGEPAPVAPQPERRKPSPYKRESRENRPQRPRTNPIALQREREEEEAKKKRQEELKREKERKAQHYYNKVKPSTPTKKVKMINEQVEEMDALEERPKSWWGRFMRWLTT